MNARMMVIGIVVATALILLLNTVFVVGQTQQALVVQLGVPVRVINADGLHPGLQAKIPFTQNVVIMDRRNQAMEAPREEIITSDEKRLIVDAFVRYRISDPLQYYRTLHNQNQAAARIGSMVNSSLRQTLSAATNADIITSRRVQLSETSRADLVRRSRLARLGISIIDVRIRRVNFPQANQQSVYDRMTTNLEQQAAQIRFNGERQKREIIGDADRQVTVILATAQAQAGQIRGEGDGRATAIYNASFGRDPGFAAFYRSMQAYETSFSDSTTTLVLSPDSEFFRYFDRGPGG